MRSYQIDEIGGNCPVQAEGHIGGKTEFYFRARGAAWSMSVGGKDVVGEPGWYYSEPYKEFPEAGWMPVEEAKEFIKKSIHRYWKEKFNYTPPAEGG